jgi:NAD-dependent DNA ligase
VARLKYYDGHKIQVGDTITVEGNQGIKIPAVVLKIIEPHTEDAEQWNLPTGGVLMEGGGLGTFVSSYLEKDKEIALVCRKEESR